MNPQVKHNARREELFIKITDLISKEGYANLTVRGICEKLNISTGTFYHYFPEKGDLAWALFADIDEYFISQVSSKFVEDEMMNLVTFCISYGTYNIRNGVETCRCINVAPLKNNSHNYLGEDRGIFQVLLGILTRGVTKKQFLLPGEPLETARMLMVLLRGYSSDWAKRDGSYNLVEALEKFIILFEKSISFA